MPVGVAGGAWLGRRVSMVERAAAPPAGPLGAAARVHDLVRPALPVEPEVVDGGAPEPAGSATACAWSASRSGSPVARRNPASRASARSFAGRPPGDAVDVAAEDRAVDAASP